MLKKEIFIGKSTSKNMKIYLCMKDKLNNKNTFEVFKFNGSKDR